MNKWLLVIKRRVMQPNSVHSTPVKTRAVAKNRKYTTCEVVLNKIKSKEKLILSEYARVARQFHHFLSAFLLADIIQKHLHVQYVESKRNRIVLERAGIQPASKRRPTRYTSTSFHKLVPM